jgi:hypothetical protein
MGPFGYAQNGTIQETSSVVTYNTSYIAGDGVDLSTVTANKEYT